MCKCDPSIRTPFCGRAGCVSPLSITGWDGYWEQRHGLPYYSRVEQLLSTGSPRESIMDVGSGGTPVATWGECVYRRYAVNLEPCPVQSGVQLIVGDWTTIDAPTVEVITCLQVLEHIPDCRAFAQKLLKHCVWAIISVPYKWPAGMEPGHIHDPIDEYDLVGMVGAMPGSLYLEHNRLVAVFRGLADRPTWSDPPGGPRFSHSCVLPRIQTNG